MLGKLYALSIALVFLASSEVRNLKVSLLLVAVGGLLAGLLVKSYPLIAVGAILIPATLYVFISKTGIIRDELPLKSSFSIPVTVLSCVLTWALLFSRLETQVLTSLLLVLVGFLTFMFRRNVVKWSLGVLEASYGGHLALSTPLEPLITEAVGVAVLFFVFLSMIYLAFNLYINVKTLDITRLRELKW